MRKIFVQFNDRILIRKYIFISCLISYQLSNCQVPTTNSNLDLPNIIPPSQETFANSRTNFESSTSGEFTYQYPFYDKIKAPIYLNYTSGVRVNDIGSSTGMSWQLSAGGVISRIVKDETDENNINWKPSSVESSDLQKIRDAARSGNTIDTEYDWFNFSLSNGLAGSFYIDKDLNVYVESKDKVKIQITEINAQPSGYGKLLQFKITDKYGNQYYFGGTETNIERTIYSQSGPDQRAVTGWYLYKVITPANIETILEYDTEYISYFNSLSAQFSYSKECSYPPVTNDYAYSDIIKTKSIIQSYRPKLKSIHEQGTEVKFIYHKERKDVFVNNLENNMLTAVEIKYENKLIESYSFEYFDITNILSEAYYNIGSYERTTTNRYFLKSITKTNQNTRTEFEYYDLNKLPPRFSLNSDYYGFPNGKLNYSPFPEPASDNNFGILDRFHNSFLTADKKVNPLLASVGNLKKITHPTKGVSEILYEPNKTVMPVNEDHYLTGYSNLNIYCSDIPYTKTVSESYPPFISNGTPINFIAQINNEIGACSPTTEDDTTWSINIKENGVQLRTISFKSKDAYSYETDPSKCAGVFDSHSYCPVQTVTGKTYDITFTINAKHPTYNLNGQFTIIYNKSIISTDKPVYFGGSRISSLKESNIEGNLYTRKFYYSKLADISSGGTSIADYNILNVMAESRETSKSCGEGTTIPYVEILNVYKGYQNNILPYFNNRRNSLLYTIITEVIDNKSASEKKYSYVPNQDSYIGTLPMIYDIPNTNSGDLQSNLLLEENIYKYENGSFDKYITKTYNYDFSKIGNLKSYVFRENFTYTPLPGEDPLRNISYGFYENIYGFYNPTSIITNEKISNNILTTTLTNQYSDLHYQLTSQKTTFPDGSAQLTNYKYAHDKPNQKLTDANMVGIPLISETIKTANNVTKTISKTETIYPTSLPDTQTGNLLLPKSASSLDLLTGSMATDVTYNQYNSKGNLLQYTTKSGIPTAIVWGYNNTQPIAKIEGATYSQVSSLAGTIVTASDTDASAGINNDETSLIDLMKAFREGLPNYNVTTYTYDPLVGVRSITPPSGVRQIYIYDNANRLKEVRENSQSGNLLKEYQYNYKH